MRALSISGALAILTLATASRLVGQDSTAAPIAVSDDLRFTSITAGGSHSCGLTAAGKAYCWGRNDVGQLGDSSTTDRPTPTAVAGGIVFRMLSAGGKHTCGISTDDDPYCWGLNDHGQLGNGNQVNTNMPMRVGGNLRATTIAAGGQHTCATQVHWDKQDRAVCWGSNSQGQLGDMAEDDTALPSATFGVIRYVSLATGNEHTCGATKQGKVFCWGANARGELGNGSASPSRVPFLLRMTRRETFTRVVAGASHTCGLTSDGKVFCWGDNTKGQIGNGKGGRALSPAWLRDAPAFTSLTAGGGATCGLQTDGSALCWGSNATGQFGTASGAGSSVPAPALPGTTWTALSVGRGHACGLRQDGAGLCWGRLGS